MVNQLYPSLKDAPKVLQLYSQALTVCDNDPKTAIVCMAKALKEELTEAEFRKVALDLKPLTDLIAQGKNPIDELVAYRGVNK